MRFVVRSATPPTALLKSIRRAIDAGDPKLAVSQVATLQEIVDRASAQMAFTMTLIAAAAAVALLLGIIGIYGVMSYIVSQRTSEIGVRLALGAEPGSVAAMILRQGGVVALAGAAIGLVAALAGSRVIASLLFGISPRDPGVFAGTTLLLLIVAALACWLPARRAARLSPLEALRVEERCRASCEAGTPFAAVDSTTRCARSSTRIWRSSKTKSARMARVTEAPA